MRILIIAVILVLSGCATNELATAVANRPPSTCQLPVVMTQGNTTTTTLTEASGPVCEQQLGKYVEATRYAACAGFTQQAEGMCLMAVALGGGPGSGSSGSGLSQDYQLLIADMQERGRNNRFYVGSALNLLTFGLAEHYANQRSENQYDFLTEAVSGPRGPINITKSDDGMGEGGSGGGGDQFVVIGDDNQSLVRGEGSAVSDGRNPVFMGMNRPDSSFETSNNNQNNAPGAENNNSPAVSTSDDDGGQSIIPGI